jgi:hypothetical protein
LAGLLLPGCFVYLSAEPTTASDGAPAWKITCKLEQSLCLSKAHDLCPRGYTTLDDRETYEPGSPPGPNRVGGGGPVYKLEILVECNDARPPSMAAPAPKERVTKCTIAYRDVDEVAKLWAAWYQREPAADIASRGLFLTACYELDDHGQRCLIPEYGKAHQEECLEALAPFVKARAKLDALLLSEP